MAKWSDLKAAIAQIIKTNGNQEITGQLLQNVLFNIVSSVGENSTFAGIATTTTSPGTLDGNIFYLAVEPGIYANFNGIELVDGEVAILEWKGSWAKINSGIASSSKISELGLYPVVVSKASSGSSALDLREIKVSLKKNSLLKFRVDISGSEISTYQMLSFYGGMHLGQTSFNIGEDYVLPLSREFNASTDIRFGAFIKNATPGTKAKFTCTLNYQNNPENPIGNEKLADGAVTSEKLADGAVTSEKLADDAISENNLPSLSRNFATSVELRKCGFYWNNVNTGSLSKATSEIDGLIVPVMFDNTDLVIVGNIPNKYGNNVVFYSDYPSTDTYIGVTQNYKNNRVTPKAGSKYALFTIVATTPFKAFAYQSIVENGSVDDNKIKDASITFSKKIINPIFYNAPFTASIVKEVYISKEDIPADAKDVENPIFCLGQILYTFGSTSINRIRIYYLTNEDTYKQAFGEIQTEDAKGNNAIIKFGKTKESYAKINFSELKDMGIKKNTHVFFDSTGKYPFINSVILNRQFSANSIPDRSITNEKLADDAISENNLPSLSRNFATSVELRKCGFYWNNVNTGSLSKATSEIDGLIVPVMFDNTDLVIVGNIPNKYGNNVVFYSDYPSTDTYIGVTQNYKNNRVTPKAGSKYALFTIVATTPFKAFAYQSIVENGSVDDNKIKDASITFSKKIINPIFYNAPFTASIVKEVYISKEDIPADAKDVENPIFCLGQILYTFGSTSINRIRIYYLTNEDTYKQAFGEIQTEDAKGNNAIIKFGKTKESYAKINFSELKDMGIKKNTHVFFDSTGKYPFINSVILNRQFSANSIPDRSIPNEKLETDLTELNNRLTAVEDAVEAGLSNTELFSIGDSLFAGGTWQKKTAEILNITFDQNKNADPSFPLSIGGTDSDMSKIGSTYFRVKNLVTKEYIKDSGENAIIVLENVNDGTFDFNPADRTYKMDKQYSIASLSQEQLNLISNEDRVLNAVAGVRSLSNGKKLTITALPTIEGDVTIKTGWAGPGVSTYNIHVIPQENDDLTRKYIIERIIEYSYKGIFDTAGEDGNSVYFTNGNNTYETTLEFTDTGKTGMACSVETVSNEAPWETFYWYNGENTEDENWGNTLNWVKPTKSSAWKSSIEELLRLYPKAHIFIANFPAIGKAVNDYYDSERGIYDEKRWYDANKERKDKQLSQFKAISEFYNIPLLDVWGNMNMSASNWNTFFPEAANVHPLKDGYEREGILIAALLKNFI